MRRINLGRLAWAAAAVVAVTVLVVACGSGSQASSATVQVPVTLSEFKIVSPETAFAVGMRYQFVIKNEGTVAHDWAIMPRGQTDEGQALIMVEEEDLATGATVTREFTFDQAGDFEMACHVPGHYEAGMLLPITVK